MNTIARKIVLALTALVGSYVGVWAAVLPQSFYDSFPGFGFMWVSVDGPFNEHLIRDVGALYLAIAAIAVYAFFSRSLAATRVVGVAWTVFGIPHLGYHVAHLHELSTIDAIGNVISLGGSLLLGLVLLIPQRRPRIAASVQCAHTSDRSSMNVTAITLFVDDLAAAKQFYSRAFALPVHYEDEASAVFQFGNTLINLLSETEAVGLIAPGVVAPGASGARMQLTITVDDVDAACAQLAERGVTLLNGPMDRPWGIRTAAFQDPAGHVWEFAH